MSITLKELADFCDAQIVGGNSSSVIDSAADITSAQLGQVTQLTNSKYTKHLQNSNATACFIAEGFAVDNVPESLALLVCADPEMSFIKATEFLHPATIYPVQIAPEAIIGANVSLADDVYIGPYAVICVNSSIGKGSVILAGAYLGNNVSIGENCRIYPYAVIYDDVVLGNNVIIHSGAIIGADGFGYKFRN